MRIDQSRQHEFTLQIKDQRFPDSFSPPGGQTGVKNLPVVNHDQCVLQWLTSSAVDEGQIFQQSVHIQVRRDAVESILSSKVDDLSENKGVSKRWGNPRF